MLMLAEQTVWADGLKNGVYLTDDSRSKMLGFQDVQTPDPV